MLQFELNLFIEKIRSINCNHLGLFQRWMAYVFLSLFVILFLTKVNFHPLRCEHAVKQVETNTTTDQIEQMCLMDYAETSVWTSDVISREIYLNNFLHFDWCLLLMASLLGSSQAFWNLRNPKTKRNPKRKVLILKNLMGGSDLIDSDMIERLQNSILHNRYMITEFYAYLVYCYFIFILQVICFHCLMLNSSFILLGFRIFDDGLNDIFKNSVSCKISYLDLYEQCSLRLNWLFAFCYVIIWLFYVVLLIFISICLFNLIIFNFYAKYRLGRISELVPSARQHVKMFLSQPEFFFVIESFALKLKREEFNRVIESFVSQQCCSGKITSLIRLNDLTAKQTNAIEEKPVQSTSLDCQSTGLRNSNEQETSTIDQNENEIQLQTIEIE